MVASLVALALVPTFGLPDLEWDFYTSTRGASSERHITPSFAGSVATQQERLVRILIFIIEGIFMNIQELVDKLRFIDTYLPYDKKAVIYSSILTFAETQLALSAPAPRCK